MSLTNVVCEFCAHCCRIPEGGVGRCGVRENRRGKIVTKNYGEVVALAVDPIEKKPLYHFMPGSEALSVALTGCNFTCKFCQNYSLSQPEFFSSIRTRRIMPEELEQRMMEINCPVLAYTYGEPTIWRDYMLDVASLVKQNKRKNVMISNGYFSEETLEIILNYIDAFNIDLKGGDRFYRKMCGAKMEPVLSSISKISADKRVCLEVTTLLIEKVHTVDEIMWLAEELEKREVKVWHLSRFFPHYKMCDLSATTEAFLHQVIERIKANFNIPHLYAGNSGEEKYNQTICPDCGKVLISRNGWQANSVSLNDGHCVCGHKLYGCFSS